MAGEDGLAEGVSGFGVEVAGVVVFGASDFGAAELGLAEGDFDALLLAEAEAFALELAFALGFVPGVLLVAERRRAHIKRNGNRVRLAFHL